MSKKLSDIGTLSGTGSSDTQVLVLSGNTLGWADRDDVVSDLKESVDAATDALEAAQAAGVTVTQTYDPEIYAYGVQRTVGASDPTLTRIGNATYHKTLPVHSLIKGGLLDDDGNFTAFADQTDWTDYDRTGASGQVMVEIPEHYEYFYDDGETQQAWVSLVACAGFTKVPKMYISAYEAAYDRTNKVLCSIVNEDEQYYGGSYYASSTSYDADDFTLCGKPVTGISLTAFRTYARKRGTAGLNGAGWNCYTYNAHKTLYWLFTIEYATLNCQLDFTSELTDDGYHQGGLGAGVTTLGYSNWTALNSVNPFIPCGYTDELGNQTGTVTFTMPRGYDCGGNSYYVGEFDEQESYESGYYYSDGDDLYKCIADCESGTDITDTDYFTQVTRTTVSVPRYRGIENPFGHIWKRMDGALAYGTDNQFYTTDDPSLFSSTSYDDYTYKGTFSTSNNVYIKEIMWGTYGDLVATSTGGSSTTYFCDYTYTSASGSIRCLAAGGQSYSEARCGLSYLHSVNTPSITSVDIGTRLCFFPAE